MRVYDCTRFIVRSGIAVCVVSLLASCAGKLDYVAPAPLSAARGNSKVIDKPRDQVWDALVPRLGKEFFVINNLDKSSGLINVSYSGDPELYVDCGRVTSYVKNASGERTYEFNGSRANYSYEVMVNGQQLYRLNRTMRLEGRVNLVLEAVSGNRTMVTASTRYVLTRSQTAMAAAGGIPQSRTDSINLNTASRASFAPGNDGRGLECVPTGKMENELLALVQ